MKQAGHAQKLFDSCLDLKNDFHDECHVMIIISNGTLTVLDKLNLGCDVCLRVGLYLVSIEKSGAGTDKLAMFGSFVYRLWVFVFCEYYIMVFTVVHGIDSRGIPELDLMGSAVDRSSCMAPACNLLDGKSHRNLLPKTARFVVNHISLKMTVYHTGKGRHVGRHWIKLFVMY